MLPECAKVLPICKKAVNPALPICLLMCEIYLSPPQSETEPITEIQFPVEKA